MDEGDIYAELSGEESCSDIEYTYESDEGDTQDSSSDEGESNDGW